MHGKGGEIPVIMFDTRDHVCGNSVVASSRESYGYTM